MLQSLGPDIWHEEHNFSSMGIRISSRMTVVRLADGRLWLHSPIPISADTRARLAALGEVGYIVAPNRFHHLYAGDCARAFPAAAVFGAPGLDSKRPDLPMRILGPAPEPAWDASLSQVFVEGMPTLNETVWFHRPSRSLIVTDLVQYVAGDVALSARLYMGLMGVYHRIAVPNGVRLLIRDREALGRSIRQILRWDIERVVFSHNTVLQQNAYAAVERALLAVL